MTISISDLLTPQTSTQVRATMVTQLQVLGIPADQWAPGGALSLMLTVIATVFAGFTTLLSQAIGSGFLETATGGWLTLLAFYVYGVTRPAATFAAGPLTLTNTGGGSFDYPPGQVTFYDSTNGKQYTNTTAVALGASAAQTIQIQCTTAGADGSAPPGEITGLVTQMLHVTVSNPSSVVGQDALGDSDLRNLCFNKLGALSVRGPRSAYAYAVSVALNAVTGAPVNINRTSVSVSSHTGTVTIVVAAPEGAPDSNDVAGVESSIESGVPGLSPPFSGARPDCVTAIVQAAAPLTYGPTITVWAIGTPGQDPGGIAASIEAGLSIYLEGYPIGGVTTDQGTGLWASGVEAQVQASSSATVVSVEGATNLALSSTQVAVDAISLAVRLVTTS